MNFLLKIISGLNSGFEKIADKARNIVLLAMRLWMSKVFFMSGLTKIQDWKKTLMLFKYEYNTPFIDANIAAILATSAELICPAFLVIGLFTRLSALPLLIMTAVIQITYLNHSDHYYWLMVYGILVTEGGGYFSLDRIMFRK